MCPVRYITKISRVSQIEIGEQNKLERVTQKFAFRSNDYYLGLIDWSDKHDPIRRIIIPDVCELQQWGYLDPSHEADYTPVPGLQHKYRDTALLILNDMCGGFCRFCFRKRLFINHGEEVTRDTSHALDYIRNHPEISNVLLTGGDPLLLSTSKIEKVIRALREIEHVRIIRIGSKLPAFNPFRILEDPSLLEMISRYSRFDKRIYVMVQFNHPNEITEASMKAVGSLIDAGAIVCNQTPLIRGVNNDPQVIEDLFRKLSFIGAVPYYVFQCRPTLGNKAYAVPICEGFSIFEEGRMRVSGLAKRARFVMSHATGKIEVLGLSKDFIYVHYYRCVDSENSGHVLTLHRDPNAYWFEDLEEVVREYEEETLPRFSFNI